MADQDIASITPFTVDIVSYTTEQEIPCIHCPECRKRGRTTLLEGKKDPSNNSCYQFVCKKSESQNAPPFFTLTFRGQIKEDGDGKFIRINAYSRPDITHDETTTFERFVCVNPNADTSFMPNYPMLRIMCLFCNQLAEAFIQKESFQGLNRRCAFRCTNHPTPFWFVCVEDFSVITSRI